jgi:hypothetical protein
VCLELDGSVPLGCCVLIVDDTKFTAGVWLRPPKTHLCVGLAALFGTGSTCVCSKGGVIHLISMQAMQVIGLHPTLAAVQHDSLGFPGPLALPLLASKGCYCHLRMVLGDRVGEGPPGGLHFAGFRFTKHKRT